MAPKGTAPQVGYGQPPQETHFKKGCSGNPNGRPKGSLNMATVLLRTLREPVVVTASGRRKTITKLEAAMTQVTNKAASGDLGALKLLTALVQSAEDRIANTPHDTNQSSEADQDVLRALLKRLNPNKEIKR